MNRSGEHQANQDKPELSGILLQVSEVVAGFQPETSESTEGDEHTINTNSNEQYKNIHEISLSTRDQLLSNLGLRESDRVSIDNDAYFSNRYLLLINRLRQLTLNVFIGIEKSNPELRAEIGRTLEYSTQLDISTQDDLTIGMALAIEAYRMDTGYDLTRGFANINKEEKCLIQGILEIPSKTDFGNCFSPSLIEEAAFSAYEETYHALIEDIKIIGSMTVHRNPMAFTMGAEAMLRLIDHYWNQITSSQLPEYEPGRYAARDGFNF